MEEKKSHNIASSAAMITILSIVSKAMGLLRVMVIGWEYGQGIQTDSYNSAIRITGIAMNIIGAALMTVMVPVLAHVKERHGNRGKLKFFNNISNIVMAIAIVLMVGTFALSPLIVSMMYPGYAGQQFDLTVKLVRIGSPIILALGLMNVSSSYLHSYNIYRPYALMGIPFNLTYFAFLFLAPPSIEGLMLAGVFAYFTQWLIQVPAIRGTGYRFHPLIDTKDRYVHRALRLVLPTAVGQAAQQINVIVDQNLASGLKEGTVSALDNASKLNDAIIAIFITGLTTVIFPLLSEAFEKNDKKRIADILDDGIGFVFLITIPAMVGMVLLSEEIVTLLFEKNNFTAEDTYYTYTALICYSLGLMANGLRHLVTKVYYSLNDTKTPMLNGMIAVMFDIILNISLVRPFGHIGLAVSTSISITIATTWMIYKLKDHIEEIRFRNYFVELSKVGISSLVMGLGVYFFNGLLYSMDLSLIMRLGLVVLLAAVVYGLMVILVRTRSAKNFLNMIKKRAA